MKPLIKNWEMRGIPGGWDVSWTYRGEHKNFNGSPRTIPSEIHVWLASNRAGISIEQVWAECNRQWLRRTPRNRWLPGAQELMAGEGPPPPAKEAPVPALAGPELWGPAAWGVLHHFGALDEWTETAASAWSLITLKLLPEWLDPQTHPSTGAADALVGYRKRIALESPGAVKSAEQAAHWSFETHNSVRRSQGKVLLTFTQAAMIHGWKISSDGLKL